MDFSAGLLEAAITHLSDRKATADFISRFYSAVKNIGREGQEHRLLSLAELREEQVDMFTTVFIGNSRTEKSVLGGQDWMVTPRGYRI